MPSMKPSARKKPSRPARGGSTKKTTNPSHDVGDAFFEPDIKRRRTRDDEIESLDSDDDVENGVAIGGSGEDEELVETADEKRVRMATEHLERIRALTKKLEDEDEDGDEEGKEERDGKRDSLVAEILHKEQLEESGRVRRLLASRVLQPEPCDVFRVLVKHRQSVTAVALANDDLRGFSASKDGLIKHWDVESGKADKYFWPSEDVLVSHYAQPLSKPSARRSKSVLALAVSLDGRYLASGGLDRHIHLWDTRTREHLQAFKGHKNAISCLAFRQGTSQLFSGSFDRNIWSWNVEDRTSIGMVGGHEREILAIDCLRRERLLTVGRDRQMRLWKVPEETNLVFRSTPALECCCFINDSTFLSGSDDGSVELWTTMRKKPTCIMKNAHVASSDYVDVPDDKSQLPDTNDQNTVNGGNRVENLSAAQKWVSSVAVCRGSDVAASGAGNGVVRLWSIESENNGMRPLLEYSLAGFVNSLAFAKSGRFLIAGVGQEPRLGRWDKIAEAQNGVAIHPIRLKEESAKDI